MRVFFTKSATVHRLTLLSNATEDYLEYGDIKCFIVPISAEDSFLTDGNPASSFKMITEYDTDILKTDKVVYDGENYIITGIQKFDFGAMRRKEALLEKFNS